MNHILKDHAREIPSDIRALFKALSSDEKLGILIFLLKDGKMTHGQLKTKLKLNPSSLSHQLKILQKGNLITNSFAKHDNKINSYYEATELFSLLFPMILQSMKQFVTPVMQNQPQKQLIRTSVSNDRSLQYAMGNIKEQIKFIR